MILKEIYKKCLQRGAAVAQWWRPRLTNSKSWVRTQAGALLCVIYFITTALKNGEGKHREETGMS